MGSFIGRKITELRIPSAKSTRHAIVENVLQKPGKRVLELRGSLPGAQTGKHALKKPGELGWRHLARISHQSFTAKICGIFFSPTHQRFQNSPPQREKKPCFYLCLHHKSSLRTLNRRTFLATACATYRPNAYFLRQKTRYYTPSSVELCASGTL